LPAAQYIYRNLVDVRAPTVSTACFRPRFTGTSMAYDLQEQVSYLH
jgi:hypothetical protein